MTFTSSSTEYFSSNNPIQIKFSEIRNTFGGNPANIRASEYRRNTDLSAKWDDVDAVPVPRIPDAVENVDVSTDNDISIDSLRNTITEYEVTQTGTIENNPTFTDTNTTTWGGNLNKNVLKKLTIQGTIGSNNTSLPALQLTGNLVNLDVVIDSAGAIYGAGGSIGGGKGGDALYINNTYTQSDVDLKVFGKIWAGGGGGFNGNPGNTGPGLSCHYSITGSVNNPYGGGEILHEAAPGRSCRVGFRSGARWQSATPTGTRNRCRGGTRRTRDGVAFWINKRKYGLYECSSNWSINCLFSGSNYQNGGAGGAGGTGGPGRGYNNFSSNLQGNPGGSGGTSSCSGGTSYGNPGNRGQAGGDWGAASRGSSGIALFKKNVKIRHYTSNTFKGRQTDL